MKKQIWIAVLTLSVFSSFWAAGTTVDPRFNVVGNVLISDQFNNRVIEVDRQTGDIVWSWGGGPRNRGATAILGVNDAERVGELTLMTGTGIPAGVLRRIPNGAPDNRILIVDKLGQVTWQYGQFGIAGSGRNELNAPVQSTWLPNGHILITDQGNQRVIEVNLQKKIVWQYGTTGVAGNGQNELNDPNSAEMLNKNQILIADEGNNRAIIVNRSHKILKEYTAQNTLNGVAFASRLPGGHILITDANHNRIVEVDAQDHVVWEFRTDMDPQSKNDPEPTRAIRLKSGQTIISDQFNNRVIIINQNKQVVTQLGKTGRPGYGLLNTAQGLNAPYDAKIIGDYTGLTVPPSPNPPPPPPPPPVTVAVSIHNFSFDPATVTITKGSTVIWTNMDSSVHTVTSGSPGSPSGVFNSGDLNTNQQFQFTFNDAGTFSYYCKYHSSMIGSVIVR